MMMRVLMMNTARMIMIKTMSVKLDLSATFKETKYMQSHLEHSAGPCHHLGRTARTRILMRMITMMQLLLIMTMLMMLMIMMMMLSMFIMMLLVMIIMMMMMMLMLLPIMLIMLVMMMMMMTMMMTMMMVTPLIQNINLQASTSGNFRQPLPTRGAPKSPTASSATRARPTRAPPAHATRNVAPSKRILRDSPDTPCPSHARCTPTSTRTVPR